MERKAMSHLTEYLRGELGRGMPRDTTVCCGV